MNEITPDRSADRTGNEINARQTTKCASTDTYLAQNFTTRHLPQFKLACKPTCLPETNLFNFIYAI